jgi:hypothetical protein
MNWFTSGSEPAGLTALISASDEVNSNSPASTRIVLSTRKHSTVVSDWNFLSSLSNFLYTKPYKN